MALLSYYGCIIVNDMNNSITYNAGNNVILSTSLDMPLIGLK